jgi:Concanavalin A-like lectin/glucanases superfamily
MKSLSTLFILLATIAQSQAQNCIPNTNSIDFIGTSTYVSLPASSLLNITDSISIEAWVKSNQWGFTQADNTILCKHGWSSGEGGYVLRAGTGGQLSFTIGADTGGVHLSWREVISTTSLSLNTWHHVAGTFDGLNVRIYINGVLTGTNTLLYPVNIASSVNYNANIGRLADAVQFETRYWNGNIDEVRVWHRVLSQTEIAANMNNHIDTSTAIDLVGYWRMNDGTGTTAADWSGNNISGNIISGTWSTDVPFSDGPPMPIITYGFPYLYSSVHTNIQWNLNGTPISGANFLSYIPTQNGSYTVTATDSVGCSVTSA